MGRVKPLLGLKAVAITGPELFWHVVVLGPEDVSYLCVTRHHKYTKIVHTVEELIGVHRMPSWNLHWKNDKLLTARECIATKVTTFCAQYCYKNVKGGNNDIRSLGNRPFNTLPLQILQSKQSWVSFSCLRWLKTSKIAKLDNKRARYLAFLWIMLIPFIQRLILM